MADTPYTSPTPYCTPAVFVIYHDWRQAADLLSDDDTQLANSAAVQASPILAQLLLGAAGEIESACFVSGRYGPDDLNALTGSTQAYLQKINADLAFWQMFQRRFPDAQPKESPGGERAIEVLERLKLGERIFGLAEVVDAGLASVVDTAPAGSFAAARQVSNEARRFFGTRCGGQGGGGGG